MIIKKNNQPKPNLALLFLPIPRIVPPSRQWARLKSQESFSHNRLFSKTPPKFIPNLPASHQLYCFSRSPGHHRHSAKSWQQFINWSICLHSPLSTHRSQWSFQTKISSHSFKPNRSGEIKNLDSCIYLNNTMSASFRRCVFVRLSSCT